jgi:hypothetical protein
VHERRRPAFAAAAALLLLAGCAGGHEAPSRLLDGTRPERVPAVLDGIDGAVMTKLRAAAPSSAEAAACGRRFHEHARPPIAERVGVDGRSLTFATGTRVFACDAAAAAREGAAARCGGSEGRREAGALTDARLDLANCTNADGDTVGFVWVQPKTGAAFVAVNRDGWTEVYPVGDGGLPVRVATAEGIDAGGSALAVTVTQYATDGRILGKEELQAQAAG